MRRSTLDLTRLQQLSYQRTEPLLLNAHLLSPDGDLFSLFSQCCKPNGNTDLDPKKQFHKTYKIAHHSIAFAIENRFEKRK